MRLAVVGGGVAGLMACRRAAAQGADVAWFADAGDALGTAYDTRCGAHLLNVPASRMGLDTEDPAGFHAWLAQREPGRWAASDFVPRATYARYLAEARAALPLSVERRPHRAVALRRDAGAWQVEDARGARVAADVVLLAPGLPLRPSPAPAAAVPVWEAWDWFLRGTTAAESRALRGEVLVVGSGLTAIDMVVGLRDAGFAGPIRVVSPSGRWPQPHAENAPPPDEALRELVDALGTATSAPAILAMLRAAALAHPWRGVLDALRPHTNALWAAWPLPVRQRLLRRGFGVWNRHRHRVPPQVLARVVGDPGVRLARGRVAVREGRAEVDGRDVDAALVLLAAGPLFGAGLARDPLLAGLLADGALARHPLGGYVSQAPDLHLVGALRFGERFETTAVPDLRAQVAEALPSR